MTARPITAARLWQAYTRIVDAPAPHTHWRLSRALQWRRDILDRLRLTIEIDAERAERAARHDRQKKDAA